MSYEEIIRMLAEWPQPMRARQFEYCLDAALQIKRENPGRKFCWDLIIESFPLGKVSNHESKWVASRGRLVAMILQASQGELEPVFADYHQDEFLCSRNKSARYSLVPSLNKRLTT